MPRLEVRVSEDLQRDLDAFAREDETTRNEIIRRAMALYAHARAEVNQGGAVILQSAEERVGKSSPSRATSGFHHAKR